MVSSYGEDRPARLSDADEFYVTYEHNEAKDSANVARAGKVALGRRLLKASVATNIRNAFVWLLMSLLGVGMLGITALLYTNHLQSQVVTRVDPLIADNKGLLIDVLQATASVRSYLLTGQGSFTSDFNNALASYQTKYRATVGLTGKGRAGLALLASQNGEAQRVLKLDQQFISGPSPKQVSGVVSTARTSELIAALDSYEKANRTEDAALANEKFSSISRTSHVEVLSVIVTALGVLLGLLFGLFRAVRTRSEVDSLLRRLKGTLNRMRDGDLEARAQDEGLLEEAELAEAINSMADQKAILISQLETHYAQEKVLRERLEDERNLSQRLSQSLYRDLDVSSALERTIAGLGSTLSADRVIARIVDKGLPQHSVTEWTAPSTSQGKAERPAVTSDDDQKRTKIYEASEVLRSALFRGETVVVDDLSTDERVPRKVRQAAHLTGLGSFISVPVIGSAGPEAILVASTEGRLRKWSGRDQEVAQTMAHGLAATLAAIHLYEGEKANVEKMRNLETAKDSFLASVSHELRTPLTSIVGYLELLQDDLLEGDIDVKYGRMFDAIGRNSQRLLGLIENILTTSRIEAGSLELNKVKMHISLLLMRVAEAVAPQIKAKNLDLQMSVNEKLPEFEADLALIERVLLNLLSNAIKFTPDGGTIRIEAARVGDSIGISVADSGVGIPEDELQSLFNKFYRASTARDNAIQGTGLGLVISKAIVEKHGGHISLTSELGNGTTFTVELPLVETNHGVSAPL